MRQYRVRTVGPPETRARVCVWCSRVLIGAHAAGPIRGAYRVGVSRIGRGASVPRWDHQYMSVFRVGDHQYLWKAENLEPVTTSPGVPKPMAQGSG